MLFNKLFKCVFCSVKKTKLIIHVKQGNKVQLFSQRKEFLKNNLKRKRKSGGAPLSMPKIRKNPYEEIIPINTGCLNQVSQ